MKRQKNKVTQLLVLMVLSCVLVLGNLPLTSIVAEAAAKKTAISATEMTIPIAKLDSKIHWNKNSWEISGAQKLTVKNAVKGATYQFASSNTKVVTVGKDGGYLTGVKAGTATITCTQTYNKKKTVVGKCKVTVKNAAITIDEFENVFPVGSGKFDISHYYSGFGALYTVTYRNPKATYTLSSNSKDFSMKEVKYDASKVKEVTTNKEYQSVLKDFMGERYFYGYEFTAKKAGTYTVTVKETYNKKTKTLGKFKVVIKDTSIAEPETDIRLGGSLYAAYMLNYTKANTIYNFTIENYDEENPDNNVVKVMDNGDYLYFYGNKVGTAKVTVTEGKKGTVIGTVTITVSEAPCEEIYVESEYTTYVNDYFKIYYDLEPWDTTDKVTIESDNPDVLKVEYNEEYEDWVYSPLKEGEANITIKCGEQSVVSKVIVEEW